ncbi:MAG: hypothetical protein JJ866_15610 [Roseibium sp.]|uniref:hypothetical protein n=1 Tax=Roseibium sp. TaxID=1936156 RepID=UPI001B047761|nr:hypothetical protein [Roseibium sp.]MBO6893371.1 hypothetical protein [Roseibium sp.]MBO6932927.1 hypothetical protein [Roseibium sp.]
MGKPNSLDDPNSISWFDLSCKGLGKAISRLPLAGDMVDVVCDRVRAREDYMEIRPALLESIAQMNPNNKTILLLCKEIILTAEFGACRANFRRQYIDGKNQGPLSNPQIGLVEKLPSDPNDIMFGYWKAQF